MKYEKVRVDSWFEHVEPATPGQSQLVDAAGEHTRGEMVHAFMHVHLDGKCFGSHAIGEPCRDGATQRRYVTSFCEAATLEALRRAGYVAEISDGLLTETRPDGASLH